MEKLLHHHQEQLEGKANGLTADAAHFVRVNDFLKGNFFTKGQKKKRSLGWKNSLEDLEIIFFIIYYYFLEDFFYRTFRHIANILNNIYTPNLTLKTQKK